MLSTKFLNFVILISILSIIAMIIADNQIFSKNTKNQTMSQKSYDPVVFSPTPTPLPINCDNDYLPPRGKSIKYIFKNRNQKSQTLALTRLPSDQSEVAYSVNTSEKTVITNKCETNFIKGIAPLQAFFIIPTPSPLPLSSPPSGVNNLQLLLNIFNDFRLHPQNFENNLDWESKVYLSTKIPLPGLDKVPINLRHHTITAVSDGDDEKEVQVFLKLDTDNNLEKLLIEKMSFDSSTPLFTYRLKKYIGLVELKLNSENTNMDSFSINLLE